MMYFFSHWGFSLGVEGVDLLREELGDVCDLVPFSNLSNLEVEVF